MDATTIFHCCHFGSGCLCFGAFAEPDGQSIAQRQAIRQEAARQVDRLEQLQQQVEQAQELLPEDRHELMRQLAELAEKLRANRGDIEQSMADISNLEKQLAERLDANRTAVTGQLEALAARLVMTGTQRNTDQSAADAAAQALAELGTPAPGDDHRGTGTDGA